MLTLAGRPAMVGWKDRVRAAGIHLGLSAAMAFLAGLLVFTVWYPYPYREISGGRELFFIVIAVDVALGPLITLAIFDRRKSRAQLRLDLGVVTALQLAALAYGLWTVSVARPVHLVFEFDRFRTVHAIDVPAELLPQAATGLEAMPLTGPTLLAVRPFKSAAEKFDATMAALGGVDLAARPDLWQSYEAARTDVIAASQPVTKLIERFPDHTTVLAETLRKANRRAEDAVFVPLVGRKEFWTVLLDAKTAEVVGFLPLDSF